MSPACRRKGRWKGGTHAASHGLLSLLQVWERAVYSYVLPTTLSQVSVPLRCCWDVSVLKSLCLAPEHLPLPHVANLSVRFQAEGGGSWEAQVRSLCVRLHLFS